MYLHTTHDHFLPAAASFEPERVEYVSQHGHSIPPDSDVGSRNDIDASTNCQVLVAFQARGLIIANHRTFRCVQVRWRRGSMAEICLGDFTGMCLSNPG